MLAACPNLVQQQQLVAANLELLHSLSSSAQAVRRLVLSTPHVLTTPMHAWQEFLAAYGLQERQIWRMLASQPRLLLQGSIYGAGRAIMFLRQLGWSDVEVSTLVIQHPEHCRILLVSSSRRGGCCSWVWGEGSHREGSHAWNGLQLAPCQHMEGSAVSKEPTTLGVRMCVQHRPRCCCRPHVQLDVDSQLQPVLQHLMQEQGMSQHEAAAFLRSNPAVLHSADFQQQVQQRLRRQQMQLLALV